MIDVTVKVPEDRVADFYSMYGTWLNAPPLLPPPSAGTVDDAGRFRSWSDSDTELAAAVWDKFSDTAKRMFSTLIDEPGRRFSGEELSVILGLPKGKHAVAGLLGWPRRFCSDVSRALPWSWSYPDGELAVYWFTPENAALFREARDRQA
jgi:Family of unknown function (DUF6416)